MLRIYLDWNIFTCIKDPQKEPYISIQKKLEQYKDFILIPYSPAHLSDLHKGWDGTPKNDAFITKDLQFISEMTNNHLIVQYWKASSVQPAIRNPEEYFEEMKVDKSKSLAEMMDFEKLFSEIELDEETRKKVDTELNKLKNLKFESDSPEYNYSQESEINGLQFPSYKKGQSMMEFIKESATYLETIMKDPVAYRNLRNLIRNGLKIDTNISQADKPIERLDIELSKTLMGKSFTDIITEATSKKSDYSNNKKYDFFLTAYSQLDAFGFHPDKLSRTNTHENLTNDAQHAFYAAHCDIFVTNDHQAAAKAKVLYEKCNISTLILKPSEFVSKIDSFFIKQSSENFIANLFSLLTESLPTYKELESKEGEPRVGMISLNHLVLQYFNTCLIQFHENKTKSHIFVQAPRNYGDFIFYSEISNVVNEIFGEYGDDLNQLGAYQFERENILVTEGKWPGRKWDLGNMDLSIHFQDGWFKLVLNTK